jgi:hypothetical protein
VGQFARGVALGACITMPCQLIVGYLLRNTANVYVATLALVAGPTVVGQVAGVAMVHSPLRRTLARLLLLHARTVAESRAARARHARCSSRGPPYGQRPPPSAPLRAIFPSTRVSCHTSSSTSVRDWQREYQSADVSHMHADPLACFRAIDLCPPCRLCPLSPVTRNTLSG